MESWQDEIIKAQISQEIGVERSMENSDTSIFLKSFEENLISCVDRDSFDKSWSSDLAKKFPEGGWRTINGASVFINNGKVIAGLDGFNKEIDTFFEQKGKKTEGKKKENNKMESLLKIMDGKVKNNGYSLKKLYDEVLWGHGSSNGAAIFSEFIKRKKEEGDTKVMDEFNRTSFVENVNPNNNKKPKTTEKETKEESKDEITLGTFVDIANKSKDVKDFMKKVVAIKGVPSSVANEFQNKYGDGGKLTMEQASQNFMDAAKGKEKEVTKEKPQEPRTKKESPESKREIYEMTKEQFNNKRDSLLKDWKLFWNVSDGGKKLNDDIINKYPLQVASFLRELIELGGLGYTDTSYLSRNKSKSDKMMAIKDKYNLNMQDINVMFSKQDESHKAWIRDALLMGKNVPVDVLKDYPDLALRYGQKKESPESKKETSKPQLSPDQKKGLGSISKLTTQAKELNKKQIYDTKSFKINKDTLKDMVDVSSQIEEKFLSKETRDKIDEIKEELDNFVNKDVYVQKPNGKRGKFLNRDKEFESDLEDKETLSDKIKFIVDEYNKENEDGESEIVGIDEYFPKIKDLLVDMAKEHSSKKATEILNYKLF